MLLGEWVLLVIGVLGIVGFIIFISNVTHKEKLNTVTKLEQQEGAVFYDNTKVIKKGVRVRSEGLYQPQCIMEYGVLFLTNIGEEKFYLIEEETFNKLEEGQKGTLVLINGKFFDFENILEE